MSLYDILDILTYVNDVARSKIMQILSDKPQLINFVNSQFDKKDDLLFIMNSNFNLNDLLDESEYEDFKTRIGYEE